MKHIKLSILLVLIIICGEVSGQNTEISPLIRGYVYDPDNEPAKFSTAVLMNRDSVFMKGTLTSEDGLFLFGKLKPGEYYVMIRNVEFHTYISDMITLGENEKMELENIKLETRITNLAEVVIRGEKAMVEVHPDKIVYNLSGSVNATGKSAMEVLRTTTPGVTVDMDNNIILQGKSGVRVYINGRPSRLSGDEITIMLEGMRSEDIESIETISNPSAKYEAEGAGGIINIVMKKNPEEGFNGNLTGSYSRGYYDYKSLGATLNYSSQKINVFTRLNASDNYKRIHIIQSLEDRFLKEMDSENVINSKPLNISGGFDFQINSAQSLSIDANLLLQNSTANLASNTIISDLNELMNPELLIAKRIDTSTVKNNNINLNYSYLPNRSSGFSLDISYGTYSATNDIFQPNEYFSSGQKALLATVEHDFNTKTDIDLFSAKFDYVKSLGKLTLSAGTKYSYIQTDNGLKFFKINNQDSKPDSSRSNDFSYLEKIAAAYIIVEAMPVARVSINAGLRVENTSSLGELVSAVPNPDDVVARNYTDIFPNVSISYDDKEKHAISLSIGRRITRPDYVKLNPFEVKQSELSSIKGNPFLKPNYITNYQVTYSYKRKLVISNTYSVTDNFFARVFETVGDKGIVLVHRNLDEVINNGLALSYPLKVSNWWNFSTFLIYNYSSYKSDLQNAPINLKQNSVQFRLQNNLKLPLDLKMELTFFTKSSDYWGGTLKIDGYHYINLGLKREFFKERILLQVAANDLFNTGSIYYYNSNYGGIQTDGIFSIDLRRVGFSATYKFGNQQAKKARQRKSALEEEMKRITNE